MLALHGATLEAREAARGGNGPAVRDEDKGLQAHNVTVDRCPIEGESLREFQGRTNPHQNWRGRGSPKRPRLPIQTALNYFRQRNFRVRSL